MTFHVCFVGARWCLPARPLAQIFHEVCASIVADLAEGCALDVLDVDLEDEEQDALLGRGALPAKVLDVIDYVPTIVLYRGEGDEAEVLVKLVGQLPKRHIDKELRAPLEKAGPSVMASLLQNNHTPVPR